MTLKCQLHGKNLLGASPTRKLFLELKCNYQVPHHRLDIRYPASLCRGRGQLKRQLAYMQGSQDVSFPCVFSYALYTGQNRVGVCRQVFILLYALEKYNASVVLTLRQIHLQCMCPVDEWGSCCAIRKIGLSLVWCLSINTCEATGSSCGADASQMRPRPHASPAILHGHWQGVTLSATHPRRSCYIWLHLQSYFACKSFLINSIVLNYRTYKNFVRIFINYHSSIHSYDHQIL